MVAGNQHHARAGAGALQQLLHHVVLCLRPVDVAAHGPEVHHIPNEEDVFRVVFLQEIQQPIGLAGTRAQMDVGDEDGLDLLHVQEVTGAL